MLITLIKVVLNNIIHHQIQLAMSIKADAYHSFIDEF